MPQNLAFSPIKFHLYKHEGAKDVAAGEGFWNLQVGGVGGRSGWNKGKRVQNIPSAGPLSFGWKGKLCAEATLTDD